MAANSIMDELNKYETLAEDVPFGTYSKNVLDAASAEDRAEFAAMVKSCPKGEYTVDGKYFTHFMKVTDTGLQFTRKVIRPKYRAQFEHLQAYANTLCAGR